MRKYDNCLMRKHKTKNVHFGTKSWLVNIIDKNEETANKDVNLIIKNWLVYIMRQEWGINQ